MKIENLTDEQKYMLLTLVDVGTNVASLKLQVQLAHKQGLMTDEEFKISMERILASMNIIQVLGELVEQDVGRAANDK